MQPNYPYQPGYETYAPAAVPPAGYVPSAPVTSAGPIAPVPLAEPPGPAVPVDTPARQAFDSLLQGIRKTVYTAQSDRQQAITDVGQTLGLAGTPLPTAVDVGAPPATNLGAVPAEPPATQVPQKTMTFGNVLVSTTVTLVFLILIGLVTMWIGFQIGPVSIQVGPFSPRILTITGWVCFLAVVIVAFFARGTSLAVVLVVLEGIALGAFCADYPHFFVQAVTATIITTGLSSAISRLFTYKSDAFNLFIMSVISYAAVVLINLGLYYGCGLNLGLMPGDNNIFGIWAWLISLVCVIAAVVSLVDDFDHIDTGISNDLPVRKSWVAAAGLAITPIWLYFNLVFHVVKLLLSGGGGHVGVGR